MLVLRPGLARLILPQHHRLEFAQHRITARTALGEKAAFPGVRMFGRSIQAEPSIELLAQPEHVVETFPRPVRGEYEVCRRGGQGKGREDDVLAGVDHQLELKDRSIPEDHLALAAG